MKNAQTIADRLNTMELSQRARDIIATTDMAVMGDLFDGLETAEDVEKFIEETYGVEDDWADEEDLIVEFLNNRIDCGDAEYEMVTDGYDGNIEAYIRDYKDDFEVVLKDGHAYIHRKDYNEYYEVGGERVVL